MSDNRFNEVEFFDGEAIVCRLRSCLVPPEGAIVQIARKDYTVDRVYWAVDTRNGMNTLRAIVEISSRALLSQEKAND